MLYIIKASLLAVPRHGLAGQTNALSRPKGFHKFSLESVPGNRTEEESERESITARGGIYIKCNPQTLMLAMNVCHLREK